MRWLAILLFATPAYAADEPTVTLTKSQLVALTAYLTSNAQTQILQQQAADAINEVNKAFSPKPEQAK